MKIGNTSINLAALESITKEQFIEINRGKILDVEKVANSLSKHFKKEVALEPYSEDSDEEPKYNRRRKRKSE